MNNGHYLAAYSPWAPPYLIEKLNIAKITKVLLVRYELSSTHNMTISQKILSQSCTCIHKNYVQCSYYQLSLNSQLATSAKHQQKLCISRLLLILLAYACLHGFAIYLLINAFCQQKYKKSENMWITVLCFLPVFTCCLAIDSQPSVSLSDEYICCLFRVSNKQLPEVRTMKDWLAEL